MDLTFKDVLRVQAARQQMSRSRVQRLTRRQFVALKALARDRAPNEAAVILAAARMIRA